MELGPLQTRWIESLEAHPERQGTGCLGVKYGDGTYKACCLGEGGLVAGLCEWNNQNRLVTVFHKYGGGLSKNVYEALGLKDGYGCSLNPERESLAMINDNSTPWSQIAKILRETPEDYFVKSV